jgi:hypothetical protein
VSGFVEFIVGTKANVSRELDALLRPWWTPPCHPVVLTGNMAD